MAKLTIYNLGNAHCCRIELNSTDRILVDYADTRDKADADDKRAILPDLLWEDLDTAGKKGYRVVAFSHLDTDHIKGASDFFYFEHAKKYQDGKRAKIDTLWAPAAAITEEGLDDDARIIRAEARHRLKKGKGIVVFSRPGRLKDWLEENGLTVEERADCIVDAGQLVQGFSLSEDQVEFFVHSPHAHKTNEREIEDRNSDSLVFQARFEESGQQTDVLFTADVDSTDLGRIVDKTRDKGNEDRLHWDVYMLPHHSSYKSVNLDEKGDNKTTPTEQVKWLCEEQGSARGYIVSTSKPIPKRGTEEDKDVQPPHRQAANYYKEDVVEEDRFLVTMERPNEKDPKPVVIKIGPTGAVYESAATASVAESVSKTAPKAGRKR